VKDENGDLLADSHNILNRWKNCYSEILIVRGGSDVRKLEIHMSAAEPLLPGPSPFLVEIAVVKLKEYKAPNYDLIQTRGKILLPVTHKLINSVGIKKNCQISERSLLFVAMKVIVVFIMGYLCYKLHEKYSGNIYHFLICCS
jgi:hypothetical protein